jgi:hypothetical protein
LEGINSKYKINNMNIKFRTYRGEAGDLHTLLIGEFNDVSFSELFYEDSFLNYSYILSKRKIEKQIKKLIS